MESYEAVLKRGIAEVSRRIKEIDETTDPTVLKSDKMLDELQKERFEALLDTCRRGKPAMEAEGAYCWLAKAIGIERYAFPEMVDDALAYDECKPVLQRMGFPEQCCERAIAQVALCEMGGLPKPNIMLNDNCGCDPDKLHRGGLARVFDVPTFQLDVPLNEDDKPNLGDLNYIADQMWEFVEWAEKTVPGAKYDEGRLIEVLETDAMAEKYRQEILQLIKHVPCPIQPLGLRKRTLGIVPSRFPNMKKVVEYIRLCRDEIGERVASGKGPYDEERLRILWAGQIPVFDVIDPRKLLLERKVAMPVWAANPIAKTDGLKHRPKGEVSEYGVVLSPMQQACIRVLYEYWGGPGKRWTNLVLNVAREFKAKGIIHYNVLGCTTMKSMGSVVADRAEKELGIPTLNLEGRVQDKDYMSQEQFEEILSPFVDKCFHWAGKPRQ